MEPEHTSAIDLSIRTPGGTSMGDKMGMPHILKPIPKPPWAILWYQNLWPMFGGGGSVASNNYSQSQSITTTTSTQFLRENQEQMQHDSNSISETKTKYKAGNQILGVNAQNFPSVINGMGQRTTSKDQPAELCAHSGEVEIIDPGSDSTQAFHKVENNTEEENNGIQALVKTRRLPIAIVDIATCDGPVLFDRVLNPNFAVTVEHHPCSTTTMKSHESSSDGSPSSSDHRKTVTSPRANTYLCICCNQSFKSLFCYQKHKKRHLNPVTVDITSTTKNFPLVTVSDNKAHTKDLNVQFFPCKKCGCKFPSYYFVHKHKKVCHQVCI